MDSTVTDTVVTNIAPATTTLAITRKPLKGKNSFQKENNSKSKHQSVPPFPLYKNIHHKTFQEGLESIVSILKERKNILVLAGAGLSVSCGIPDFRSKGTGLYSTLDAHGLGLSSAEDLFDLETFLDNPRPFYKFAKYLYPGTIKPSPSHYFISLLEQKKKLLRVYTQNIDGLEHVAGISPRKIVYAHGSMNWAQCTTCKQKLDSKIIQTDVMEGRVPYCQKQQLRRSSSQSSSSSNEKSEKKRKRDICENETQLEIDEAIGRTRVRKPSSKMADLLNDTTSDNNSIHTSDTSISVCGGVIKPGVTFFGEKLDDKVRRSLTSDRSKADAVIVIGTSLSVAPMSKVLGYLPPSIPRILINKNHLPPPPSWISSNNKTTDEDDEDQEDDDDEIDFRNDYVFDACLLGNCDDVTRSLIQQLGWDQELEMSYSSCVGKELPPFSLDGSVFHDATGDAIMKDKTLLFGDANVSSNQNDHTCEEPISREEELVLNEVVHCDGCSEDISGAAIMRCSVCFDFDLCLRCFKKESKKHFRGKHSFVKEIK